MILVKDNLDNSIVQAHPCYIRAIRGRLNNFEQFSIIFYNFGSEISSVQYP